MNDQMQQQILARLDLLVQMYVRQAIIDGCEYALISLVLLAFASVAARRLADQDDEMLLIFGWVGHVTLLVAGLLFGCHAVDLIANPNLWAFKEIVSTLR